VAQFQVHIESATSLRYAIQRIKLQRISLPISATSERGWMFK
jgi:hypothetical protein